ncbi:hypothetical protein HMPREF1143_1768 [Peptoanaerobacter stomatis]|uniref:Uncharacterized protein n=1 Tax=Peptoanaerobacter stomatis TaxID=796937 RepID=J5WJZ5_9FIRM|nr:hypothetical protein [Peptoanaerobacter stomatis]EJU22517.1 hypothetical protein HMPREF1143_1768 [Peptoanaerobacter stomatis]
MKVLLRFNKKDNSFIDMQTVNEEYIYKYQDVEELPNKDGYYTRLEYDEKAKKAVMKYIEIPKTEEQILKEELKAMKEQLEQTNRAVEDLAMQNAGV